MAENTDRENLPQATVRPKRRVRISAVWVIPLFVAVVAIGIAVQRILSEGPTITIVFKAAEGLEAGKTAVKYRDVAIGQVTSVQLSSNFSEVKVTAQIDKSAAELMVEDAKFWVVEPRVTLSGVSGLGTLLSGNYIGFEPGKSEKKQREFTGLETPLIVTEGQPGRQFLLKADNLGSLGIGSPIYYRRLQAGEVIAFDLAADGSTVDIKLFIQAPYDRYVSSGTRFWNASGLDVSVGAGGVEVQTESLIALLVGGVAFDMPPFTDQTTPAPADTVFTLYSDRATAMKEPEAVAVRYVLYFTESLRGLSVGAPVTLLGLPAGEVTDVGLDLDPATFDVRGRVEFVSYPERVVARLNRKEKAMGKSLISTVEKRHAFFQRMVEQRALRAQLRSGSLLTGQLYVAFDFFPDAPKAKIDWSKEPTELPVVPSTLPNIEAKLTSIIAKLDEIPYEAIGDDVKKVLAALQQTLKETDRLLNPIRRQTVPKLNAAVDELRSVVGSADQVLESTDATLLGKDAPGQQELRNALQEISRAARSLRVLTDYLQRHPSALIRGKTEGNP